MREKQSPGSTNLTPGHREKGAAQDQNPLGPRGESVLTRDQVVRLDGYEILDK